MLLDLSVALVLLFACHLPGASGPDDTHGDDSSVGETGDSTAPKSSYTCVALDQGVPEGAPPAASGYEYCSLGDGTLGYTHRVDAVACELDRTTIEPPAECGDPHQACHENADCEKGSVCELDSSWGSCTCVPTCMMDADCAPGMICVPTVLGTGEGGGLYNGNDCVPAACSRDADCPSGPCVAAKDICGHSTAVDFRCWTALDECHVVADCPDSYNNAICTWMSNRFACTERATCD